MAELDELRADLEELESLAKQAKRPRAKDLLQREVLRVTEQIKIAEKVAAQNETSQAAPEREEKVRVQKPQIYTTKITSYGWDQSEKFVKLYINLEGVEKLPKEKLDANFSSKSMDLVVRELKGKNHQLQIRNLLYEIIPSESSVRAKTGSVTVLMRKASTKTWECLTKLEKAEVDRKKPNVDTDKDPSEGLMDMMKKMYDEGDDEMKRTIAKAWTESRGKQEGLAGF